MDEPIHSASWVGDEETHVAHAGGPFGRNSPTQGLPKYRAAAGFAWLVGGGSLVLSTKISVWLIPAIPISVPPFWMFGVSGLLGLFLFISGRGEISRLAFRTSLYSAALLLGLSLFLPPLAIYSYLHAEEGPRRRMQLISPSQSGEGAIFAFQDGSSVEAPLFWRSQRYYYRNGECFVIRTYTGQFGFSWMKVLETTRPPQNSELWWTIRREDCFSNKPLASLGH